MSTKLRQIASEQVLQWLGEGDAAIRWQTMRDLLDCPESEWEAERKRVATIGWGKQFIDRQDQEGTWDSGIYSPKWTSTTYTLLTLIDLGIEPDHPAVKKGADQIMDKGIVRLQGNGRLGSLQRNDVCVWGFYLHITAYFGLAGPLLEELCELLLEEQMHDGGWNCRRQRLASVRHGSFHTTFNVLEGLRVAARRGLMDREEFLESEAKAMEFMLQHRMYKSDKTGEVINEHFTEFSYPPRWHYDVLRGLDYIRETPFAHDPRLSDALELLESHAHGGIWAAQNKHAGKTHFNLEPTARQSRWNTLRALRVLRACA